MDQTPATRFVDVLGRLGYKTQQQIADLLDIARPTAGTIVRYEKPPSFESVSTLKQKHPEINMEWVFTGAGSAFVTGDAAPISAPAAAEEPAPAYTPTATDPLVRELIQQLAEQTKHHREELRELKRDHREDLSIANRTQETLLIDMRRQIEEAKAETLRVREEKDNRIYQLEEEVYTLKGRAGLRPLTAEEQQQLADAAKEKSERTKAGFQPAGLALAYSNPDFTRPQEAKVIPLVIEQQEELLAA